MRDVIVLLSGGLDSTTLAATALKVGRLRACLCARYGQAHMEAEMMAAQAWCAVNGVERVVFDSPLSGVAEWCDSCRERVKVNAAVHRAAKSRNSLLGALLRASRKALK